MYFRACFNTASVAKINFITMYPVYDILLEQQFVYKLQSLPRPTRTREECPLILFPQSYDVSVFVRSNELLTQGKCTQCVSTFCASYFRKSNYLRQNCVTVQEQVHITFVSYFCYVTVFITASQCHMANFVNEHINKNKLFSLRISF